MSRSFKDRVVAKLRVGPGATAPPASFVAASGQSLHLAFETRNCRRSRYCAEMRAAPRCKTIRNVACNLLCTWFGILDLLHLFQARAVTLQKQTKNPKQQQQKNYPEFRLKYHTIEIAVQCTKYFRRKMKSPNSWLLSPRNSGFMDGKLVQWANSQQNAPAASSGFAFISLSPSYSSDQL